jgi:hypothetical protein
MMAVGWTTYSEVAVVATIGLAFAACATGFSRCVARNLRGRRSAFVGVLFCLFWLWVSFCLSDPHGKPRCELQT